MPNPPESALPVPIDLPIAPRLAAAVERFGASEVVERAIALLGGANAGDDFLLYVGGDHALGVLEGAPPLYWPEVWGARTLLYVWDDSASAAVSAGLGNQAWRVREMCARVSAERRLDVAPTLVALLADEVARVRAAAARALAVVGGAQHSEIVGALVRDPEKEVRRAAQQSRDTLASREIGNPEL